MWRYTVFMDWKTQYCYDVPSSWTDAQIQCNPNQNSSRISCGNQQTNPKIYVRKQRNQNGQHSLEKRSSIFKIYHINQRFSTKDDIFPQFISAMSGDFFFFFGHDSGDVWKAEANHTAKQPMITSTTKLPGPKYQQQ